MSESVNFIQGRKELYNPSEMLGGLFFSKDSKEILLNGESYGNATPADEEDITAEEGNLKLKDRAYDEASFSGKGYKILRKNIVEGKNILTLDMINQPNTIYEIRYDFDGNGQRLSLDPTSRIIFAGGSITNGNIRNTESSNFFLQGLTLIDFDVINSSECRVGISNIQDSSITLCLSALPGYLSKYNLIGDGVTDNSIKLNSLFQDPVFNNILKYKDTTLVLGRGYYVQHEEDLLNLIFLFKDTINIGAPSTNTILNLTILIDADIKFDWSSKQSPRTLLLVIDELSSEVNYDCFNINVSGKLSIIVGRVRKTDSMTLVNHKIDGGRDTIPGTYYEGVKTISGNIVYSSFTNNLLRVLTAQSVIVSGGLWTNTFHGITTSTVLAIIEGVEVYDIAGDNGITCGKALNIEEGTSNINTPGGVIVRNCLVRKCEDLGISILNKVGIIDGCIISLCGNNNISDTSIYGINHSYNNGGGISVELALSYGDDLSNIVPSVEIRNCSIYNCYNYAISVDCSGVKVSGCTISGIINTSKEEYETSRISPSTGILYNWLVRKRGIIGISPLNSDLKEGIIYVFNSVIDVNNNILWASHSDLFKGVFYNCTISNYTEIPENKFTFRDALLLCCSLHNYNFGLDDQFQYYNCKVDGSSLGDSLNRPISAYEGYLYFDTTLNRPVYWDGNSWVDPTENISWATIE